MSPPTERLTAAENKAITDLADRAHKGANVGSDLVRAMQDEYKNNPGSHQAFNDALWQAFKSDKGLQQYLPQINLVDINEGGGQNERVQAAQLAGDGVKEKADGDSTVFSSNGGELKINKDGSFTQVLGTDHKTTVTGDAAGNLTTHNDNFDMVQNPDGSPKSLKVKGVDMPLDKDSSPHVNADGSLSYTRLEGGQRANVTIGLSGSEKVEYPNGPMVTKDQPNGHVTEYSVGGTVLKPGAGDDVTLEGTPPRLTYNVGQTHINVEPNGEMRVTGANGNKIDLPPGSTITREGDHLVVTNSQGDSNHGKAQMYINANGDTLEFHGNTWYHWTPGSSMHHHTTVPDFGNGNKAWGKSYQEIG